MGLHRIQHLQRVLQANNLAAALINHPRDLFYYAGTAQPCNLVIPAEGEPCLLIRRAEEFVLRETWVPEQITGEGFSQVKEVLTRQGIREGKLGLNESTLPANLYKKIVSSFAPLEPVDLSPVILQHRMVKEPGEIEAIRAAARAFAAAHHADIARTYILGKANDRQGEIFAAVKAIQDRVLSMVKPGTLVKDLYEEAEQIAYATGYYDYFQGFGKMKGHYVGHGLGLELDEPPTIDPYSKVALQENMVLAIEPKLIVPEVGGFVLEDTILVTDGGYELLSPIPRTLFEIEVL